jgi:signal transduction histidine kinase
VRRFVTTGLPVQLRVDGEPRPLSAGIDLTAYRLIQEALGRAREADAGRATLLLRYEPSELTIEITDDGEPKGRRLLGLRERVAVYGGKVQASPPADGGWRVSARLPIGRAEPAALEPAA